MNKNETIAKHIWHDILQCSRRPLAWGLELESIKVIENGTSFKVDSMIQGLVKIQKYEDSYSITILPDNIGGTLAYMAKEEKLISTIDEVVRQGILCKNTDSPTLRIAV